MTQELLNTLYVLRERAYLHLDHDTIRMEVEKETAMRMPLLNLRSIVCFGDILLSPALIYRCVDDGRTIVLLNQYGQFKARIEGPSRGNVLLRRAQHHALSDHAIHMQLVQHIVAGKIQNCRKILMNASKDVKSEQDAKRLREAALEHEQALQKLPHCTTLDDVRGYEGFAAKSYFHVFDAMIGEEKQAFAFVQRTRRPPLNRTNALLSFVYTLLRHDCVAALESVGLDPQIGYLHTLRPGRPALALDLMEEFRPFLADRLVLSLINRRQVKDDDFVIQSSGAVYLTDEARKKVITMYQKRKHDEIAHRAFERKITVGLLPFVQARLLARTLRGDLPAYPPFLYRS